MRDETHFFFFTEQLNIPMVYSSPITNRNINELIGDMVSFIVRSNNLMNLKWAVHSLPSIAIKLTEHSCRSQRNNHHYILGWR